jgi:transposase
MSRVSYVKRHLSEEQVKDRIRTAPTTRCQQKWTIIYNALVDPRPASEIAKHTATSLRTVRQVIGDYNRMGEAAIHPRPKQRKNPSAYLSFDQETAFLESFNEPAKSGHLTTIQAIQEAFEAKVETQVAPSTIYRLLDRHGWRKLAPRPYHPQGDKADQKAFKQTFQTWFKPPYQIVQRKTNVPL